MSYYWFQGKFSRFETSGEDETHHTTDKLTRNAGQTCVSANRVLVQSGIHDEFVARLAKAMEAQIVVGNGKEASVTQVRDSSNLSQYSAKR